MSFNLGNEPSATDRIPLSPTFAPSKLAFDDEDEDQINNLCTPHAQTRNRTTNNKENAPPETPSSSAKDSQYKEWLQCHGFYDLFRNSLELSSVIKVLRQYSDEIWHKVEQILQKCNKLTEWKTEIGEPALDTIERYKLVEKELKNAQLSLTDEYNRKNIQCENLKNELLNLQNEINDICKPKIKEYDNLLQTYNSTQKQLTNIQNENKILKNKQSKQTKEIIQINKINKDLNKQINTFQLQINKQKNKIIQLNNDTNNLQLECELSQQQINTQQQQIDTQQINTDNKNNADHQIHAIANEDNDMHLPAIFHQHNSSGFDWDFADDEQHNQHNDNMNDENIENENQNEEFNLLKYRDLLGIDKLMSKIDSLYGLQEQSLGIVTKEAQKTITNIKQSDQKQSAEFAKLQAKMKHVCEEQDEIQKMHKTFSISKWEDVISKHVQKSINTSFSSICSHPVRDLTNIISPTYGNDANNINVINDKIDSLTKYLETLEIDRRIITVYKKIDNKIDELSNLKANNLQKLLHSIQFKQESQQSAIDNSLATFRNLFEKELTQIIKFISENQKEKKNPANASNKPVINHNNNNNYNNNNIDNININHNELISINCNRLNEMFMSEFVMVLINEICYASDDSFNRLLTMILKIIHNLHQYSIDSIYSNTKYEKIECILIEYKSEIDNLFINIFQNTINNICRDLINDKIERIKLQSRIAKLTNKFVEKGNKNKNKNKTLSKTQSKKIFQQFHALSLKQFYLPLGVLIIFTFLCGLCCGYCLLPSPQHNHPFM